MPPPHAFRGPRRPREACRCRVARRRFHLGTHALGAIPRAPARGHGAASDHSGAHRRDRSAALAIRRHAGGEPLAAKAGNGRGRHRPTARPGADQGQVPAARPDQDGHAAHHAGLAGRLLGHLRLGVRARPGGLHLHTRDGPRRSHSPLRLPGQRAHVHPRLRRPHPLARRPTATDPGSPRRARRTPLRLRRGGGGARPLLRHSCQYLGRHRPLRRGHQLLQSDSRMAVGWFARRPFADAHRSAASCWPSHSACG